ncbi:MAG: BamA/TamA family outer membrane protein [Gemmatimonadaceae bacterium]|nr:BamA/TamA family outer membrane protein [Gemmatimonadaceae bacterium]
MTTGRRISHVLAALLIGAGTATAQQAETPPDSTVDLGSLLSGPDRGGLTVTSGRTYNRVEGMPILIGPTYRNRLGPATLSIAALGIIRTANRLHWDAENIGHRLSADVRVGRRRGYSAGAESFDLVSKIEPWQLSEPDAALASFFSKRDYFDYFGRHGGRIYASVFADANAAVTAGYSSERWSSRRERDVFTLFRGDDAWRINPRINDAMVHVADLSLELDTRNSKRNPWAGWFVSAQYEHGAGNFATAGTRLEASVAPGFRRLEYGRAFLDLRRYNRISPRRQLNTRLVLGGWLHGDPLPLERRFSVGGIGNLPGFDFRRLGIGTDVGQCSPDSGPLPGRPAECERAALAQIEYRHELVSELFDVFNRNGIRVRGAVFRVKPAAVAFADAGRGWLVGPRRGTLQYPSGSVPGFDTFRTDVGLGLDLGIAGIYVAKAVSESKEPANFFIRIRNQF